MTNLGHRSQIVLHLKEKCGTEGFKEDSLQGRGCPVQQAQEQNMVESRLEDPDLHPMLVF